jgi:hypothetical protein
MGNYPGINVNQPISVLNRWQKPGDIVSIQRFNSDYSLSSQFSSLNSSDAAFTNASYIKLKNVSLSWRLPNSWIGRSCLQEGRFFILGQNLVTFTKYKGINPDAPGANSLPPLRVITFGVHAGF